VVIEVIAEHLSSCHCVSRRSKRATITVVSQEITQRELRNNSGDIMRRLDQGESFVVSRNGVAVGELSPLRRHRFVSAGAVVTAFKSAARVDFDRFRADLDRTVSQEIAPRG
jgi:antitoxin (DNA-binding transcriptional repressor) of toxin-antitoxin stability system